MAFPKAVAQQNCDRAECVCCGEGRTTKWQLSRTPTGKRIWLCAGTRGDATITVASLTSATAADYATTTFAATMVATTFTAAMAITTTAQTEVVLPGAIRMLLRCACSHDAHMCCDLPSVVCMRRAFPRYRLERFGHSVVDARAPDLHPPGLSPTHALSLDSRDACPCALRAAW